MRTIVIVAFLLALLNQAHSSELQVQNCFLVLDEQVGFNLLPWANTQQFYWNQAQTVNNSIPYTLNVGFCSAYFNGNYGNVSFDGEFFNLSSGANYFMTNASSVSDGFIVNYVAQNSIGDSAQVNFNFTCASNSTTSNATWTAASSGYVNGNSSSYYANITVASTYGCGASLSELLAFMSQYKYIFIPIFFILGSFFCFFGRRTFDIALFLIVAMGGVLISGSLFMQLTNINSSPATKWVIFGVCILIGIGLGYLALKFEKVGFFGLGLVLGVVGGFFLYQLILSPILSGQNTASSTGTIVFWVTVVVLGLIGGFLGMWLYEDIKIISTAVIGSYTMVRSISVLFPNTFPPEIQVAEGTAQFTPIAYVYLVFIIIFAILGLYVQFRHKKQEEDEKAENNADNYTNNIPDYA